MSRTWIHLKPVNGRDDDEADLGLEGVFQPSIGRLRVESRTELSF